MSRPAQSLHHRSPVRAAYVLLIVLALVPAAAGTTLLPPDPTTTVGTRIPLDGFVDENGQALPTDEFDRNPRPWIVSPMYTRCPSTCSAVTAGVRRALAQSGLKPAEYHVVSFSFDPNETADALRAFRARMELPPEWLTLRAGDPQSLARTLRSLDFRTITMEDGNFNHPNLIAVLAPDMRLAGYLFGVTFSPDELARLVRRARSGVSAADWWRPYLFLFAAIGFLASAALFGVLLSRRRKRTGHRLGATVVR